MVNPELQIFKCFGCGVGGCLLFCKRSKGWNLGGFTAFGGQSGHKTGDLQADQGTVEREISGDKHTDGAGIPLAANAKLVRSIGST